MSNTSQPPISGDEFDLAMSHIFAAIQAEPSTVIAESEIDKISSLLLRAGRREWSLRPRTYTILRLVDSLDAMDSFIHEGLNDIAFPYHYRELSSALSSPRARAKFIEKQPLVMTKATDLEQQGGRHRTLDADANIHFVFIKLLGRGGSGEVDHVRGKLSIQEFARKRINRRNAFRGDKEALKMFVNEIDQLKRLRHRHLVTFIGSYSDPRYIGLLMSPVADCDLKHFLERTPFSVHDLELLRGFYGCLCSGLAYLHEQKCRHKDIKPENILVKGQTVFITDFGTARDMTGQSRSETTGTPGPRTARYAAPEVMDWNPRGYSSDIWSLGCVFLDMTVVLKGKTIESMRAFLNKNGNGLAFPHQNLAGLALLFDVLTTGTTDNQPIVWVKAMMRKFGKDRVSASPLLQSILEYNDDHRYYGLCCDTNDSSDIDSSYAGSVMEGVTLKPTSTDDSDTYHTRLVQNTKASETQHLIGADVGGTMDKLEAYISPGTPGLVEIPLPNEKSVPDPASTRQPLRTVEFLKPTDEVLGNTLAVSNLQTSSVADSISNKTDRIERQSYSSALGPNEARDKLVSAVKQGNVRAVQRMLSERYDIGARTDDGLTLLMHAVRAEQYQVVLLLLTEGADVNARTADQLTALHYATRFREFEEIVNLLLEEGADINARTDEQRTALHYAVEEGSEATVRLLLEKGADIEARTIERMTPLHWAAQRRSEATVRLLLEKGADIEARTSKQMTPLHYAVQAGSEEIVNLLLEKGADIEAGNYFQSTALHCAAQAGSEATVRLLLEKGADIEARDPDRSTALHYAADSGSEATVRLLLEKGANMKAQALNQTTPLHCAVHAGSEATVRLLLEGGADINARTADLTTPLHWAAEVQSERTICLLLEKGADQSAENWKGQKPKDMIKRRGNAPWLAELFKDPSS